MSEKICNALVCIGAKFSLDAMCLRVKSNNYETWSDASARLQTTEGYRRKQATQLVARLPDEAAKYEYEHEHEHETLNTLGQGLVAHGSRAVDCKWDRCPGG